MPKHTFWVAPLAALAMAAPLQAQQQATPRMQITPYAGYLKSGAIINGPFGTALRNAGAPVYGGEMSLRVARGLELLGNVAYSEPGLEVGAPILGGLQVANSSVLLYDAGLRLSVPAGQSGLTPFVQAGAGAMRQSFEIGPLAARSTGLAYNVGAGVDLDLAPRLGLRLMAKDYIGKFDAREATELDVDTRTTHNWAIGAGLRLGL